MRRIFLLLLLAALLHFPVPAVEVADVPDIFNPALARRPRPGEWVEYLLAFPVDPLENRLRGDPVPPPKTANSLDAMGEGQEYFFFKPSFDLEIPWRVTPLRLEVLEVDAAGCMVKLTFAGNTHEVLIPAGDSGATAEFYYEAPQPRDHRRHVRLGGEDLEVDVVRRKAENFGFARLFSPDVPFGIFRFATENVDLVLVGKGSGQPPPFPLRLAEEPNPLPGGFYGQSEEE